jgi:hypothetical protein
MDNSLSRVHLIIIIQIDQTGCCSLVGSDCSFAKSTAFRSENHGSVGYDLKNGGPVSH